MTHYPFPDSRGTKIALAAFFTAMLFLALTINIAWTGKAPWLGFWG